MLAPETPIEDVPLAVVDVETTGLNPQAGDRVCEIAVLRADPGPWGEPGLEVVSLVNPGRPIGAGARAVNGIEDDDVANAPPFHALIAEVNTALDGAVLVAHNVPFDVGFLRAEYRRAGTRFPTMQALDTLELARRCFRFRRNGLGDVAWQLGVSAPGLHRAEGDVWATYYVLQRMIDELREFGYQTLGDFLAARRVPPPDRVMGASGLPRTTRNRRARRAPRRHSLRQTGRDERAGCQATLGAGSVPSSPTATYVMTSAPFALTALWLAGGRIEANQLAAITRQLSFPLAQESRPLLPEH